MPVKVNTSLPTGIYERDPGSGIYYIQFTSADGKRRREKAGNLSTAKKLLKIKQVERLQGKLPEVRSRKTLPFGDLIDDAIAYAKAQNDAYNAHDQELKLNRIRAAFGKREADSIKKNEIVEWLEAEAKKRGWQPSSRNRYQAAWSLIYRVAIDNERTDRNPASGIRRLQENNQRVRFLSPEEEATLVASLDERFPSYRPIVVLAIHSGMRTSEMLRSQVGDLDRQSSMLRVRQKKVRTAPPYRYVPLSPRGVEAYDDLAAGKSQGDLLCTNLAQEALGGTRYWFDPCAEDAGLVDFLWHDLRHTAASRWVMSGVPLSAVAIFLGHTNIQMTQRYAHLQPANNTQAIAGMMSFYQSGIGPATKSATAASENFPDDANVL
jgi:integrase